MSQLADAGAGAVPVRMQLAGDGDAGERLCDHVAVIAKGKVVASGPLDEVRFGPSCPHQVPQLPQHP